jgi:SAM-dependent methyltransferase
MKIRSSAICRLLNRCFPRAGTPALGRRRDHLAYVEWEFANAGEPLREFSPHHDIRLKRILDVGCGLGGKSAWYALNGAKEVVAVDLDPERVERAAEFAAGKRADNARFLVQDAGRLEGLEDGRFQMVLLNDAFEHLERPAEALMECWRVLAPGGTMHIVFPPYGSPWGAHLFAYVKIPWAQRLFADEPLLEVWKEGFRGDAGDGSGMITQRKLEEVEAAGTVAQLRQLNKMTIRRFRSLVDASPFTPALIRERVPRWVFPRPRRNWYLRERLVTRVTAVLEKREAV